MRALALAAALLLEHNNFANLGKYNALPKAGRLRFLAQSEPPCDSFAFSASRALSSHGLTKEETVAVAVAVTVAVTVAVAAAAAVAAAVAVAVSAQPRRAQLNAESQSSAQHRI